MELRESVVSSGRRSSACTRGPCPGQCRPDLESGGTDPVVGLSRAAVVWRGTSSHLVTL